MASSATGPIRPWVLKALVQGAVARLPAGARLNALLRGLLGGGGVGEAMFERKLGQCARHLEAYASVRGSDARPASAIELGTGHAPIVPVALALAGVERVLTVDIRPLLAASATARTVELFARHLQAGWPDCPIAPLDPGRVGALLAEAGARSRPTVSSVTAGDARPEASLGRLGVSVMLGELADLRLAEGSLQLLVSNNTLEHIPEAQLEPVLRELRRVAAPEAVMSHFVDISDHYAHFDRSISEFNYLRFSDRSWRLFNNALHHQNRLRASDYVRIVEDAGFKVVATEEQRGEARELARITPAPRFRAYSQSDLLTLRLWITAVPRAPGDLSRAPGR
ncbi:MAG TPA: class I SAM-dependent methyltransferase [Solirubrobacteraceae bacterium]|nr:class I SAM-dependent methyltransferase [Solirubrobacteraceae bacterium]